MSGMISLAGRFENTAECRVIGAFPVSFLNLCAGAGLSVSGAETVDEHTCVLRLPLIQLDCARSLAHRCGCELTVLKRSGGSVLLKRLIRRRIAAAALTLMLLTLGISRLFVWNIAVSGNRTVSTEKILSALADCGIRCGCFWPEFTADNLRSELLVRIPELSWATVNIRGSCAEVIVRERVIKPALFDSDAPADISAAKSGFVTQVQALNGTALVHPGSAVTVGETLISGDVSSVFSGQREVHAVGTVMAETYYELCAAVPVQSQVFGHGNTKRRWAIEIGTSRINIFGNSSFSGTNCAKIKKVWNCGIPGLFSLPVRIVTEEISEQEVTEVRRDLQASGFALEQALREQLLEELGSDGTMETADYTFYEENGRLVACLRARCRENIGLERMRVQEDETP